jgi:hypothetical protein
MSFKASGESAIIITFGGDKRGLVGLFLSGLLGGMLKMVRLGESALLFVSQTDQIRVNCEIGEPTFLKQIPILYTLS